MSAAAAYRDDSAQISLRSGDDRAVCSLCPHACRLHPGETGFCRTRANRAGTIRPLNYGRFTSLALDPIEKKPLYHFHPGSFILSVGSFGCNLACPFCQNASIATADASAATEDISPARLAALAGELSRRAPGNIGVAFTYNEPLLSFEYIMDAAPLLHAANLAVVLVTNGTICAEPLARLLPHVDAMNIDLKGWQEDFYRWVGGDLGTVRETIEHAVTHGVHVEVTTLIIPGRNDSAADMDAAARMTLQDASGRFVVGNPDPGPDAHFVPILVDGVVAGWVGSKRFTEVTDAADLAFQRRQESAAWYIAGLAVLLASGLDWMACSSGRSSSAPREILSSGSGLPSSPTGSMPSTKT